MSKIPDRLELMDIRQSFQEVWGSVNPLLYGNMNFHGRRLGNIGKAIDPFDAVRLTELKDGYSYDKFRAQMKADGLDGFPGILSEVQKSTSRIIQTTNPSPLEEGKFFYDPSSGIIYYSNGTELIPLNLGIRVDVINNRGAASAYKRQFFAASDRHYITWFSHYTGVTYGWQWIYLFGCHHGIQPVPTAAPNALGPNGDALTVWDEGYLYWGTTSYHLYRWNGTAWWWGPGDDGVGQIVACEGSLTAGMWGLCDGATYSIAVVDGTLNTGYVSRALCTANEIFLTAKSTADTVESVAETPKWHTSGNHCTDSDGSHAHAVPVGSFGTSGGTGQVAVSGTPGDTDVASVGHTHTGPSAEFNVGAGGTHYHNLADANARLKAPKAGDGGVPLRFGLKWYVRL